jgi:hypothetical protein
MEETRGSSRNAAILSVVLAWLPVLTVVAGGLWGLYTYIDHQNEVQRQSAADSDRDAATRRIEAQRPFLEKQLALYFETAQVAGRLVTLDVKSGDWSDAEQRFWALYWSELSMVEHKIVEQAMVEFGKALKAYKEAPNSETKSAIDIAALNLAHAIRSGIEDAWKGNQLQRDLP